MRRAEQLNEPLAQLPLDVDHTDLKAVLARYRHRRRPCPAPAYTTASTLSVRPDGGFPKAPRHMPRQMPAFYLGIADGMPVARVWACRDSK